VLLSLLQLTPFNYRYGDDVAILAGDALLSYSFEHVATKTKHVSAEKTLQVVGVLGGAVGPIGLAGGQVLDLECVGERAKRASRSNTRSPPLGPFEHPKGPPLNEAIATSRGNDYSIARCARKSSCGGSPV